MRLFILLPVLLCSFLFSCNPENSGQKEDANSSLDVNPNDSLISLNSPAYDLSIVLPKEMITDEFRFEERPNFGHVVLYANEDFHLIIERDKTELAEFKSNLENQQGLFNYKFYDETDSELLCQATLPDGSEIGYKWIQKRKISGIDYIVRTDDQGKFSRENIRLMQSHLKSLN